MCKWNFLFFFFFGLLPFIMLLDTAQKALALSYLRPLPRYLCTLIRSSWASSSWGWTVEQSSRSMASYDWLSSFLMVLIVPCHTPVCPSFLALECPELYTALQMWSHEHWLGQKDNFPHSACNVLQGPRMLFVPEMYWLLVNLPHLHVFFYKPALLAAVCMTLHLPLLASMRTLSAHLSSLLMNLWMAAQPSGASAAPDSFASSANLLRVNFVPSASS